MSKKSHSPVISEPSISGNVSTIKTGPT